MAPQGLLRRFVAAHKSTIAREGAKINPTLVNDFA
jgi:hypothetical protein